LANEKVKLPTGKNGKNAMCRTRESFLAKKGESPLHASGSRRNVPAAKRKPEKAAKKGGKGGGENQKREVLDSKNQLGREREDSDSGTGSG